MANWIILWLVDCLIEQWVSLLLYFSYHIVNLNFTCIYVSCTCCVTWFLFLWLFIGHNWGSEHDPDTDSCAPSSSAGRRFIMYSSAVSGYEKNNQVSLCLILPNILKWLPFGSIDYPFWFPGYKVRRHFWILYQKTWTYMYMSLNFFYFS